MNILFTISVVISFSKNRLYYAYERLLVLVWNTKRKERRKVDLTNIEEVWLKYI